MYGKMSEPLNVTTNYSSDILRAGQPLIKKPREPPTCSHCGTQGHTIRGCTNPESMNIYRELLQLVNRVVSPETIVHWLNTLNEKVLQFIVMKYCHCSYETHTKTICISILSFHIDKWYAKEISRETALVQQILTEGSLLLWSWMEEPETISVLYNHYCEQFEYSEASDPNDDEGNLVSHIITTCIIPPNISYYTIKRLHKFIVHKNNEFIEKQSKYEKMGNTIEYEATIRYMYGTKQIDCPICFENIEMPNILSTNCNHDFCHVCITKLMKNNYKRCICPLCREPIRIVNRWATIEPK